MGRRRTYTSLNVLINGRLVGRLEKVSTGAISFAYDKSWLEWEPRFPISLSLPLRPDPYHGAAVEAVFDNLLPDNTSIRRRVAETTGAHGTDSYSLLEQIGRDCIGAMQFIPDDMPLPELVPVSGKSISNSEIESLLANLKNVPLGIDIEQEFRISVAGAQEKTALLFHDGKWMQPHSVTPTTHILKPQIGQVPTPWGDIDLSHSVENEHYCLRLIENFGLRAAETEIVMFGQRKALVVKRFDRLLRDDSLILRLPQEDFCQALSIPSAQKYQNQQGPSAIDILKILSGSDQPLKDQLDFLKIQIIFWLIGATDGHAKNFSIFIRPGGRFGLTPFYDVLSTQPAFDAGRIPNNKYKLAMCFGNNRHYKVLDIHGRHFAETANQAGLGVAGILQVIDDVMREAAPALEKTLAMMPADFHQPIHNSIKATVRTRLNLLETAYEVL